MPRLFRSLQNRNRENGPLPRCLRGLLRDRSNDTVETNPVAIFEVLSPSTRAEDLVHKSAEYRATASVQRYAVLEQTQVSVTVVYRKGELWASDTLSGVDAVLDLPEIGVSMSLGEIYADMVPGDPP